MKSCWCEALLSVLALLVSCSTPPEPAPAAAAGTGASTAPAAWPSTFLDPAVLTAERVQIEGPPGLLDHCAILQDAENHDYVVRTVPEGLRIEVNLRADGARDPIRAQLDQLVIAAEQSIVVLERPGRVAVTVEARGNAYLCRTQTGVEQRAPSLRLVGGDAP